MSDIEKKLEESELPITSRIGRVAAGWARFEFRVNEIIWHLANLDIEVGACITSQIQSPSNRMRALAALVGVRGGTGDLISEINKFSKHTDSLARQRNRFVHDPWINDPTEANPPMRVEVTADRKLRFEAVETSLKDMEKLWQEIAGAIATLETLRTDQVRAATMARYTLPTISG